MNDNNLTKEGFVKVIKILVLFCLLIYLFLMFIPPMFEGTSKDNKKYESARTEVRNFTYAYFGYTESIRLRQLRSGSVELYISKERINKIPFPDRPQVEKNFKSVYCSAKNIKFYNKLILRDIYTGETIDSYWCFFY